MSGKSFRGQQRITLAELRAETRLAADALRAHRKICFGCSRARHDPYAFCDQGWEMAKRHSRAQYALRKYNTTPMRGQDALF